MSGIERIAAERQRQIDREGYDASHDDSHDGDELALAAACYAVPPTTRIDTDVLEWLWPWKQCEFKPAFEDRIHELAKAGALIAAEIDRLRRAAP